MARRSVNRMIARNSIFGWIALATGAVLLIPLVAMQFTDQVDWGVVDFIVMGALLFGAAGLYVLVARRLPQKWRAVCGAIVALAFLYIWAELAVGIIF